MCGILGVMGKLDSKGTVCVVRDVAVFNPGTHNGVDYDADFCAAIAESYDPDGIYAAKINLDHDDSGPAVYGWISALRWDGEWLRADLADVPEWLAQEITKYGYWPSRSVELWREREGLGKPYFSGCAFLGCREPAVLGMPPVGEDQIYYRHPEPAVTTSYFAAGDGKVRFILEPSKGEQATDQGKEEIPMPENMDAASEKELLAAKERLTQLEAERDAAVQLAAERDQLAASREAEIAQLKAEKLRAQAEADVAKLEADGKATPGMREAGLVELLLAADTSEYKVKFSADAEPVDFGELIRKVFNAIPNLKPGKTELAATEPGTGGVIDISPGAMRILESVGLNKERIAKHAPTARTITKGGEDE